MMFEYANLNKVNKRKVKIFVFSVVFIYISGCSFVHNYDEITDFFQNLNKKFYK